MKFFLILLFFAIVFVTVGVIIGKRMNSLAENGNRTTASIVGNYESSDSEGTSYYPIVGFRTDMGRWIEQRTSYSNGSPIPEGLKVEVIYDRYDPTNVEIYPPKELKAFSIIFTVAGFGCLALGVYLTLRKKE